MAESWSAVCRQCVTAVTDIPLSISLAALVASGLGLFVLVSLRVPPRWFLEMRARSTDACSGTGIRANCDPTITFLLLTRPLNV